MKLYKEVLIESAEQAEALPEETIAYLLHDDGSTDGLAMRLTQTADDPRAWRVMGRFALATHEFMRGWTALVTIEAEEETVERHRLCQAVPDVLHRFTTPWTLDTAKETP